MVNPARGRATYEDLRAVPEHLIAEIIDGELVTQPRPAARHARAASRLGMDIGNPFDRGKGKVAWSWLVDPVERTLEVFRLDGGHWVVSGNFTGSDAVRAEPFDAVELVLGALWER